MSRRDERGLVLPTRLAVLGISAVALAGLVFIATQPGDNAPAAATPVVGSPTPDEPSTDPVPTPDPAATTGPADTETPEPIRRGEFHVVVFNNSNVKGLAGRTSARAQTAGWSVVGADNWYGTVDAPTVYFGPGMKAAARLLADDLDINRVKPAIDPMRDDRLTVILTGEYADPD